jgi:hypothetical protein
LVSGICSGRLQDSYWRPHGSVRGCKNVAKVLAHVRRAV